MTLGNKISALFAPRYSFYLKGRTDAIHIHIVKNAGTSISHALQCNPPNKAKGIKKHYDVRAIIDMIGKEKYDRAFSFAFVRNPWDRMVSWYSFRRSMDKQQIMSDDISFKKWLDLTIGNNPERRHKNRHFKPQTEWLSNHEGELDVDFLGRFENLEEDFAHLCEQLSVKTTLQKLNQSKDRSGYRDWYDEESNNWVAEFYKSDVEAFGYEF